MQASHNHAEGTAMPYPLLISQTSHQWGLFITTPRLVELFGKAICRAVLAKEIPIFIPCSSTDSESRSPQWAPGLAEVARQKAILPSTSKASLCRHLPPLVKSSLNQLRAGTKIAVCGPGVIKERAHPIFLYQAKANRWLAQWTEFACARYTRFESPIRNAKP